MLNQDTHRTSAGQSSPARRRDDPAGLASGTANRRTAEPPALQARFSGIDTVGETLLFVQPAGTSRLQHFSTARQGRIEWHID
jgi:hypothetical protein